MPTTEWREAKFTISTSKGPQMVDGIVCGAFGIRVAGERRPIFMITHLPTGTIATPSGAGFSSLQTAKMFVERVSALADWTKVEQEAANRQLGAKVVAIWNELIALDVAMINAAALGRAKTAVRR